MLLYRRGSTQQRTKSCFLCVEGQWNKIGAGPAGWLWKRGEKWGGERGWWITHDGPVTYIFCPCLTCQGVSKSEQNSWECTTKRTNSFYLTRMWSLGIRFSQLFKTQMYVVFSISGSGRLNTNTAQLCWGCHTLIKQLKTQQFQNEYEACQKLQYFTLKANQVIILLLGSKYLLLRKHNSRKQTHANETFPWFRKLTSHHMATLWRLRTPLTGYQGLFYP